jgi:hypothetical protein
MRWWCEQVLNSRFFDHGEYALVWLLLPSLRFWTGLVIKSEPIVRFFISWSSSCENLCADCMGRNSHFTSLAPNVYAYQGQQDTFALVLYVDKSVWINHLIGFGFNLDECVKICSWNFMDWVVFNITMMCYVMQSDKLSYKRQWYGGL